MIRPGAGWLVAAMAAAGQAGVPLVDEVVRLGAGGLHETRVPLPRQTARLECTFTVVRGGSGVRLVLLTADNAHRFQRGQSHQALVATGFERTGRLAYTIPEPGDYRLVLDNRLEGRGPVDVYWRAALVFAASPPVKPRELPPGRRALVVIISLGAFGAVAFYAGRRLLEAARRPPDGPPRPP